MTTDRSTRPGGPVRALLVLVSLVAVVAASPGAPAALGATPVDARGARLSASASCAQGDIEIEYTASGVERQLTQFSAADGTVLHHYDVRVYASNHDGTEYILSQTRTPRPAGTVLAVHVTIGTSPPDAASGEFLVVYRCDSAPNDAGGTNEVLYVCAGLYGTCPTSAQQYLDAAARPAVPVTARPTYSG